MIFISESSKDVQVVELKDGRIALAALTREGLLKLTTNYEDGTWAQKLMRLKVNKVDAIGRLQDGSIHYIIFTKEGV